jgi:hypothetical protein
LNDNTVWLASSHFRIFTGEVVFQSGLPSLEKLAGKFFTRSPLVYTDSMTDSWQTANLIWHLISLPQPNSSHFVYKPGRACVLCSRRVEWGGGGCWGSGRGGLAGHLLASNIWLN